MYGMNLACLIAGGEVGDGMVWDGVVVLGVGKLGLVGSV